MKVALNLFAALVILGGTLYGLNVAETSRADTAPCTVANDGDNAGYKLLGDKLFDMAGNSRFSPTTCAPETRDVGGFDLVNGTANNGSPGNATGNVTGNGTYVFAGFARMAPGWYYNITQLDAGAKRPLVKDGVITIHKGSSLILVQDFIEESPTYSAWRGTSNVNLGLTVLPGPRDTTAVIDVQLVLGHLSQPAEPLTAAGHIARATVTLSALPTNQPLLVSIPREQFTVLDQTTGTPLNTVEAAILLRTAAVAQLQVHIREAQNDNFRLQPTNFQVLTDTKVLNPKEDKDFHGASTQNRIAYREYNDQNMNDKFDSYEEILVQAEITKLSHINPQVASFNVKACAHVFLQEVNTVGGLVPKCIQQGLSIPTPGFCSVNYDVAYQTSPGPRQVPSHPVVTVTIVGEGPDVNTPCDKTTTATIDVLPDAIEQTVADAYNGAVQTIQAIVAIAQSCLRGEMVTFPNGGPSAPFMGCKTIIDCTQDGSGSACQPVHDCRSLQVASTCKDVVDLVWSFYNAVEQLVDGCVGQATGNACEVLWECYDDETGSPCHDAWQCADPTAQSGVCRNVWQCTNGDERSECSTVWGCIANSADNLCSPVHDCLTMQPGNTCGDAYKMGRDCAALADGSVCKDAYATVVACASGQNVVLPGDILGTPIPCATAFDTIRDCQQSVESLDGTSSDPCGQVVAAILFAVDQAQACISGEPAVGTSYCQDVIKCLNQEPGSACKAVYDLALATVGYVEDLVADCQTSGAGSPCDIVYDCKDAAATSPCEAAWSCADASSGSTCQPVWDCSSLRDGSLCHTVVQTVNDCLAAQQAQCAVITEQVYDCLAQQTVLDIGEASPSGACTIAAQGAATLVAIVNDCANGHEDVSGMDLCYQATQCVDMAEGSLCDDLVELAGVAAELVLACANNSPGNACEDVYACAEDDSGSTCQPAWDCVGRADGSLCQTAYQLVFAVVDMVLELVADCQVAGTGSPCDPVWDCQNAASSSPCKAAWDCLDGADGSACEQVWDCSSLEPGTLCYTVVQTALSCVEGTQSQCKLIIETVEDCLGQAVLPDGWNTNGGLCSVAVAAAGAVVELAEACLAGQDPSDTTVCNTVKECSQLESGSACDTALQTVYGLRDFVVDTVNDCAGGAGAVGGPYRNAASACDPVWECKDDQGGTCTLVWDCTGDRGGSCDPVWACVENRDGTCQDYRQIVSDCVAGTWSYCKTALDLVEACLSDFNAPQSDSRSAVNAATPCAIPTEVVALVLATVNSCVDGDQAQCRAIYDCQASALDCTGGDDILETYCGGTTAGSCEDRVMELQQSVYNMVIALVNEECGGEATACLDIVYVYVDLVTGKVREAVVNQCGEYDVTACVPDYNALIAQATAAVLAIVGDVGDIEGDVMQIINEQYDYVYGMVPSEEDLLAMVDTAVAMIVNKVPPVETDEYVALVMSVADMVVAMVNDVDYMQMVADVQEAVWDEYYYVLDQVPDLPTTTEILAMTYALVAYGEDQIPPIDTQEYLDLVYAYRDMVVQMVNDVDYMGAINEAVASVNQIIANQCGGSAVDCVPDVPDYNALVAAVTAAVWAQYYDALDQVPEVPDYNQIVAAAVATVLALIPDVPDTGVLIAQATALVNEYVNDGVEKVPDTPTYGELLAIVTEYVDSIEIPETPDYGTLVAQVTAIALGYVELAQETVDGVKVPRVPDIPETPGYEEYLILVMALVNGVEVPEVDVEVPEVDIEAPELPSPKDSKLDQYIATVQELVGSGAAA